MKPEIIETVLTEILEEQKQVNQKLNSFTSVLMEVHDKINTSVQESRESWFSQIHEQLRLIQGTCQSIPEKLSFPEKDINQLKLSLDIHSAKIQQPVIHKIKHQHTLSKALLIGVILFICLNISILMHLNTDEKLNDYKSLLSD